MNLTSPPVRINFPQVFTAKGFQDDPSKPKYYSATLMIEKNNKEHMEWLKKLHAEAKKVLEATWPDETKRPRIPITGNDKSPIKDGDKNANGQGVPLSEKYPEYINHYVINVSQLESNGRIPVVDKNVQEIMDQREIYSGCYCRVNVNPYARTRKENPGISIGLNGVQKWADGENLGGGAPAINDMFEAASGSEDPANYENNSQEVDPFA